LGKERIGEIIESAPTAVAPVAFAPWSVVVGAPGVDIVALATRTLERAVFPPQRTDVCLTLVGAEKLVEMESTGMAENLLWSRDLLWNGEGDSLSLPGFYAATNSDKLSDIVYVSAE
jgi:hypothetical protein